MFFKIRLNEWGPMAALNGKQTPKVGIVIFLITIALRFVAFYSPVINWDETNLCTCRQCLGAWPSPLYNRMGQQTAFTLCIVRHF